MDLKRIALITALFVLAYSLIVQWNADYGKSSTISEQTITPYDDLSIPPLPLEQANIPTVAAVSTAPEKQSGVSDDLPSEATEEQFNNEVSPSPTYKYVRVKTDTLDLLINPTGGDIEQTSLSLFRKEFSNPDIPFTLLENNSRRTYIAQSGLIGKNGVDNRTEGRPLYQSSNPSYVMAEHADTLDVTLSFVQGNVSIEKVFHFTRGSYQIGVEYIVNNQSSSEWQGNLFAQIKRDGTPIDDEDSSPMGAAPFLGAAYWTADTPYNKYDFDDFKDAPVKSIETGGWVAFLQHYFVNAWIAPEGVNNTISTRINNRGEYIIGFTSPTTKVNAGETKSIKTTLYSGPKNQKILGELSAGLDLTVDYGWLWFIAQPIFKFMSFIHSFVGNWGWSIIILTFCIKLLFFPLSAASYRSMANMRRVQPEMARLKELHGEDRQAMSKSMMELYKKEKVNPLGGCLPILVQMPVFISLYWTILESVELRHAEFMFWIQDMSVMDPYFILPLIMGVTMYIQQSLNPTPPDPMQAKVMKMMPVMFTFMFLWFPAGLVLYWVVNNILSIIQQYVITKRIEKNAAPIKG